MSLDLICLGNLTVDDVVLPDGKTKMGCFGGDAIWATIGASFWGDQVRFVAPMGTDFPESHIANLKSTGWDLSGLAQRDIPSMRNWVIYEYDDRRTWVLRSNPDDFLELSPTLADIPTAYRNAKAALVLAMVLPAQEKLVPQLRDLGLFVALDPQEDYIPGNQERVFKMLEGVDVFLPSEEEVWRLLGHRDYERAAKELAECGCKIVAVKLGEKGSLIYERDSQQTWRIPIYPTVVKDTTGAGDSYSGGFMTMYLKYHDLMKAGLAGSVSASFAVEVFGLDNMMRIDRRTAQRRLDELERQYYPEREGITEGK